jgi:hypothetical protein
MKKLNSRLAKSFSARKEHEKMEMEELDKQEAKSDENPYTFSKEILDGWRSHPVTKHFKGELIKEVQEKLLQFGTSRNDVGAVAMDAAYRDGFITGAARFYKLVDISEMVLGLKVEDLT